VALERRERILDDRVAVTAGGRAAVEGVGLADVDDEELDVVLIRSVELLQPTG